MVNYVSKFDLQNWKNTVVMGLFKEQDNLPLNELVTVLKTKKEKLYDFGELTVVYPTNQDFRKVIFIGLGERKDYVLKDIQTLFAKICKEIDDDVLIDLSSFSKLSQNTSYLAEKVVETIQLVRYSFNNYKTKKKDKTEVNIYIYSEQDLQKEINNGKINGDATNNARTLINLPRNLLTPSILADYAEKLAKRLNIEYKVYNKAEITELKMGAFLAVNQGSSEEAKLIHLKYRGVKDSDKFTALIGKGLTYDSGGYSIKPKDGMAGMKGDMGGAASVLGAIEIIASKKLQVNVDVIIAATENLINSDAIVPDDIVTAMNGKTIEILNTDAEGRLTLVDAVTFAKQNGCEQIIDVATLTGGVVTALGKEITGAFTNDRQLLEKVKNAALYSGEMIWELPVDQFRERCKKSDVADYNNSPGRDGHASFAAALIAEFAEDTPWVHLDIAGTSDISSPNLLGPAGGTGVMVRTLANLFE